jgi:acetylglutamate kinase
MINIVKVGGGIIENEKDLSTFLTSFSKIPGKKILIHGGGRLATKFAEKLGIETKMIEGRRVTDDAMLEVVTMVYGGLANKKIVAALQAIKINALGLSGADGNIIKAHKRPIKDVDYGWVGDIDEINTDLLLTLLDNNIVPVIAPLTHNGEGKMLNTNADTIASTLASAISTKAEAQLVLGFELDGVLVDPKDKTSVINKITPELFEEYKASGIITDGMIPKLSNAFDAISAGVSAVKICNALKISDAISQNNVGTTITS